MYQCWPQYFLCHIMSDPVWKCLYQSKGLVENPHELWSTILEFIFIALVIFCGVSLNYKFFKKLKAEKRRRPVGRKGNVIEPIVSLYCIFQIVYWPYKVLYFWLFSNEIVTIDNINGWWPNILIESIRMGRLYIGWFSSWVSLLIIGKNFKPIWKTKIGWKIAYLWTWTWLLTMFKSLIQHILWNGPCCFFLKRRYSGYGTFGSCWVLRLNFMSQKFSFIPKFSSQ